MFRTCRLATYSNLNHITGYAQHNFPLSAYAGQNITVKFADSEDYTSQTSFAMDDTALNVG